MGMFARKSVALPLARQEDLIVEDLNDEVLIYDKRNSEAHCLTREVAMVWRVCDGHTKPADLANALGLEKDTVDAAIAQLAICSLLDNVSLGGMTRREATLSMAKVGGAVAAAPLIYSILAPTPALAASQEFCLNVIGCTEATNANTGCSTCFKVGCVCCGAGSSGGPSLKLCTAECNCCSCSSDIIHNHCNNLVTGNESTCTTGNNNTNYKCVETTTKPTCPCPDPVNDPSCGAT